MDKEETVKAFGRNLAQPVVAKEMSEKRARALNLFKIGTSTAAISRELNVHSTTVVDWIHKERAVDPCLPDLPKYVAAKEMAEKRSKAMDLFKFGTSIAEISREMNVYPTTVVNWIHKERDINPSLPDFPKYVAAKEMAEKRAKVLNLFKIGTPIAGISRELNVHSATVLGWIRKERDIDPSLPDLPKHVAAKEMAEKRAKALDLFKDGTSLSDLSRDLNVCKSTVLRWINKERDIEPSLPDWSKHVADKEMTEKRAKALHLFKIGTPLADLSRKLNVGKSTVLRWINNERDIDPSVPCLPKHVASKEMAHKRTKAMQLFKVGTSTAAISHELNVRPGTVTDWIRKERDTDPSLPDLPKYVAAKEMAEKRVKALSLFKIGTSLADISRELNLGRTTVTAWIKKERDMGPSMTVLPKRPTAKDMKEKRIKAMGLFNIGTSAAKIARELNVSRTTVTTWIKNDLVAEAVSLDLPFDLFDGKMEDKRKKIIESHNVRQSPSQTARNLKLDRSTVAHQTDMGEELETAESACDELSTTALRGNPSYSTTDSVATHKVPVVCLVKAQPSLVQRTPATIFSSESAPSSPETSSCLSKAKYSKPMQENTGLATSPKSKEDAQVAVPVSSSFECSDEGSKTDEHAVSCGKSSTYSSKAKVVFAIRSSNDTAEAYVSMPIDCLSNKIRIDSPPVYTCDSSSSSLSPLNASEQAITIGKKRQLIDIYEEIVSAPDTLSSLSSKKSSLALSASSAVNIGEDMDIIIHPSNLSVPVTIVNSMAHSVNR